ncbi:MAG: 5-formyltetrahydrofolate cyclo-ligase [Armatimonadota bacterium]
MERKRELRRSTIARRNRLSPDEIRRLSAAASSRLADLREFRKARTVMFFVSFGSEIDTVPAIREALAAGKRVAAPRVDRRKHALRPCEVTDLERDLAPGEYGIREPQRHCLTVPLEEIDAVIVPAAAWGEDGYRVGYGGGYYDRFLARVPSAVRIGLGFEMQVVPDAPHARGDLPVDILVTDSRVRRFAHRSRPTGEAS